MALPGWELPEIPNSKFPAPLATSEPIPTHGLILISCYGFWISSLGAKIHFFFLFSTYLQLPVGKAKAQWKHRGFPFKITRERRRIKRFYSSAHDFPSCSWMLNVLSQFPTPQKEFSAQTQRSSSHLLSLLGVGGL